MEVEYDSIAWKLSGELALKPNPKWSPGLKGGEASGNVLTGVAEKQGEL